MPVGVTDYKTCGNETSKNGTRTCHLPKVKTQLKTLELRTTEPYVHPQPSNSDCVIEAIVVDNYCSTITNHLQSTESERTKVRTECACIAVLGSRVGLNVRPSRKTGFRCLPFAALEMQ